ncbi:MAG TPA: hypothetical protein VHC00_02825 [Rhizobiaceae bacterium]|jgi:hypothetical protein|nr:hypothetical protein [Rhizobiaceae bacterium]
MSKILALLLVAMMGLHVVKPFGLPGLRERRDFWKIALFGLVAFTLVVLISHGR